MNNKSSWFLFVFLLAITLSSGIGCHWIIPFEARNVQTYGECYCTATIYRDLPGGRKFTEYYETDLWADTDLDDDEDVDAEDANLLCSQKIDQYINDYMNPGFDWKKANITVFAGSSEIGKSDCTDRQPYPVTYGAPSGSALSWPFTGRDATVTVSLQGSDKVIYTAQPPVEHALIRLAEHRGAPDQDGVYERGLSQIRVSHFSVELEDFSIAGGTVKEFHINNIGTIPTVGAGMTAMTSPQDFKMFIHAVGEKDGVTKTANDCYATDKRTSLGYSVSPTQFVFYLNTGFEIGGAPASLVASLTSAVGTPFNYHQPYVTLPQGWQFETSPVDLTPDDIVNPDKDDPVSFQWFENFDDPLNEKFLGDGETLNGVKFSVGPHEVAVVIHDNSGAFFVWTTTLTIKSNTPPNALDDVYSGTEDIDLIQGPRGVLQNDQDANGDAFTASWVSGPAHGSLVLNASGAFTYKPAADFNGTDTFSYKACDPFGCSIPVAVTITLAPVNDKPVAKDDSYPVDEYAVLAVGPALGVLKNDTDVDGDTMTAQKLSNTIHGLLAFSGDGSFTYTPNPSFHGSDSFTYQAFDGSLSSNVATVAITVIDLPPEKEIPLLPPRVDSLPLNDGQKTSLDSKLSAALAQVNAKNKAAACNTLQAFLNELFGYIKAGLLTQSQAQPLIDMVNVIRGELGCK